MPFLWKIMQNKTKAPGNEELLKPGVLCLMAPGAKRRYGQAQKGFKLGPFVLRAPYFHYELEAAEVLQGIIMTATSLGGVALLESLFGIPYPVAITIIVFQHIGYFLHQILGDVTISGWLTPAVPLITSFVGAYELGAQRIEAYIALQITVGVLFLFLAVFRVSGRLIKLVPPALKGGLIIGAGISALTGQYGITRSGLMLQQYPISLFAGAPLLIFLLYSERLKRYTTLHPHTLIAKLLRFGIVPGLILICLLALLIGEAALPAIRFGFLKLEVGAMLRDWSVAGLGLPNLQLFLKAIPLSFVCFILAFGEVVLAQEIVDDVKPKRPDERVDFSSNRLTAITGIRNILHGLFAPSGGLSGPNWAAMTMAVSRRYENGHQSMYSFIGGSASFNIVRIVAIMFLPITSFLTPFREPTLCLLMIMQGFACLSLGISIPKSRIELASALLVGIVLANYNAAIALAVGILITILNKNARIEKSEKH
jgi:hypothetical protein